MHLIEEILRLDEQAPVTVVHQLSGYRYKAIMDPREMKNTMETQQYDSDYQAVFLPGLWCDVAKHGKPPVDAVDIHVYHQEGGLPPREDLPVDIGDLPLLVGECGEREGNDRPGNDHLLHYFHNGKKLGYKAVFFWKFEGPGMLALRRDDKLHEPRMFDPTDLGVKLRILIERGLDSFKEA
ncbi:MAG: hypothetical protein JRF33_26660 [Deltaproteobacteria bacterium]|nr:hypothetical protein [Deltaproteobacteria bacterium]